MRQKRMELLYSIAELALCNLIYPEESKKIFGDTIDFLIDLVEKLDEKTIKELSPLLSPVDYPPLPQVKYVPAKIPNTPTLRGTDYIQRDAEPIVRKVEELSKGVTDEIEYLEIAFDFVLNLPFNLAPDQTAWGVLYYNAGICYGKMNLFAALCRRKGFETRFKLIPFRLTEGFEDLFESFIPEELEFLKDLAKEFLGKKKMPHQFLEVKIDDRWVDANPLQPVKFYELLGVEKPSISKLVKKEKKMKEVKPIYTYDLTPVNVILPEIIGRTRLGEIINKKINDLEID